jgi:excisionase family DNA binding protein
MFLNDKSKRRRKATQKREAMADEELLTIRDLQEICKIGRTTAYGLVATKQLKAVRINTSVRIRRSDLDRYLRDHEYFPEERR